MEAVQIDNRKIIFTTTLLLRYGEIARFDVPIDNSPMKVEVRFTRTKRDSESAIRWEYDSAVMKINFLGPLNLVGNAMVIPGKLATFDGVDLGFMAVARSVGELVEVTLQFFLGGTYE